MLVWFLLESVPWWMPSGGLRTNEKFCNLDQWQKQVNTSGKQPDLRIVQSSGRILFLRSLQTVSILIHADFMAVSFSVGTSSSPLHQPRFKKGEKKPSLDQSDLQLRIPPFLVVKGTKKNERGVEEPVQYVPWVREVRSGNLRHWCDITRLARLSFRKDSRNQCQEMAT